MIKAALFAMLPLAAQAGGWEEFQARCLDSYENMSVPILQDLNPMASARDEPGYRLTDQEILVIELVPDDGETACRLEDKTGRSAVAFDAWIAEGVRMGRYVETGDNAWQSRDWVEPRVGVMKHQEGATVVLRVLVTDLDS